VLLFLELYSTVERAELSISSFSETPLSLNNYSLVSKDNLHLELEHFHNLLQTLYFSVMSCRPISIKVTSNFHAYMHMKLTKLAHFSNRFSRETVLIKLAHCIISEDFSQLNRMHYPAQKLGI
jgi:hypothetical protein